MYENVSWWWCNLFRFLLWLNVVTLKPLFSLIAIENLYTKKSGFCHVYSTVYLTIITFCYICLIITGNDAYVTRFFYVLKYIYIFFLNLVLIYFCLFV